METVEWTGKLSIRHVRLRTAGLAREAEFYERAIGLERIAEEGGEVFLAAPGQREPLLILSWDAAAVRRPPRTTGLFHVALRLPSLPALSNALRRVLLFQDALVGAEYHGVSEAVYLRDPDGNGVELYADLPRDQWDWRGGQIAMTSSPLDLASLLAASGPRPPSRAVPQGIEVGHLHLHVASLPEAERFFHAFLGLAVTQRDYPGALFFAAPGYHHHIAANMWSGGPAPAPVPAGSTGLVSYRLVTSRPGMVETLRRCAVEFGYETGPSSTPQSVLVRDPNGAWLEVASTLSPAFAAARI